MNFFTPRWRFIISNMLQSLGSKSGILDQMNELEVKIFDAILTEMDIDYVNVYYNELLHFISRPVRDFNVPFICFISLMIEDAIGTDVYHALNQVYSDALVPKLSTKMFNTLILSSEVPLTPAMMH